MSFINNHFFKPLHLDSRHNASPASHGIPKQQDIGHFPGNRDILVNAQHAEGSIASSDSGSRDWHLEKLANALSNDNILDARKELKSAIRRIPYHGLWAAAPTTKKQHAILFGLIGQDLVRSLNNALGQYVTAEKLGLALKRAYIDACAQARKSGFRSEVICQEYNMVFFRANSVPTKGQAEAFQKILAKEVWKKTHEFLNVAESDYPEKLAAIQAVKGSLKADIPLMTLGICGEIDSDKKPPIERLARYAIGSSAAAKLARLRPEGFAFADASEVFCALRRYRQMLMDHRGLVVDGQPLVLNSKTDTVMLNPNVLATFRAKKLTGQAAELVAEAVSLLNCLDWVQQSRFTDVAKQMQQALVGRSLMRSLNPKRINKLSSEIKTFCLQHVPYLSLAEELTRAGGTLFWVDMKKLAVRCHIIREYEAMALLQRHDRGENVSFAEIVDSMIKIDLRVQDARDVLPQAADLASKFLSDRNIDHQIRFHSGGDDAAFLVHHNAQPLDKDVAVALGNYIASNSEKLRVAHCRVYRGGNLAEEICRLDRILAATKID